MKASYYRGLAGAAAENPSYWFSGLTRADIPPRRRAGVPLDAGDNEIWDALLASIDGAADGNPALRRWVRRTFAECQKRETIESLTREGLSDVPWSKKDNCDPK